MTTSDLYSNRLGPVLVIAPGRRGRLAHLAEDRLAVLDAASGVERCLSRWIFADVPRGTLRDAWGNAYDHQVHSLLAGSLAEGEALLAALGDAGLSVSDAPNLFVPLKTLDASDARSSDELRARHPRAFALARRDRPSLRDLVTAVRDAALLGA